MRTILFVDGRNFLEKMEDVFEAEKMPFPSWHTYDFQALLDTVLKGVEIKEKIFYFAKIKVHQETVEKSKYLIEQQRLLKTHLERQGFRVILGGVVRGNYKEGIHGKKILVFTEKGVDVSIAVDIVSAACDRRLERAVIASSDSDLQPAVRELKKRNAQSIYLGFEIMPNKGLTATTNRTILIRNAEVVSFAKLPLF